MKLNRVTITGVDNQVDYRYLKDMTDRFPFVEWGVLMSKTRKGSPRYPDMGWISGLIDFFTGPDWERFYQNFSAHVCGDLCTKLVENRGSLFQQDDYLGGPALRSIFTRIQLNGYPDHLYTPYRINAMEEYLRSDAKLILPISTSRVENHAMSGMRRGVHFLYDRSRGRGIAPEGWPVPNLLGHFGYAGGIANDNIGEVLDDLTARDDENGFWIDIETGARDDNDQFDTYKVQEILTTAEAYVNR